MQVYFAPLACSMSARISLYEAAAADAEFIYVDIHTRPGTQLLADGSDYRAVNPMGQVPAVRTREGVVITENPAVLQYIADQYPASKLAPASGIQRYRLQQWLNFISTELHKAAFIPLLTRTSPDGAKSFARQKLPLPLGHLNNQLNGRAFLLEDFTVADAYLVTILNWARYAEVDLGEWPQVSTYFQRLSTRPSVARALAEEGKLYAEEQTRRSSRP
jgi:glutathione S-transferase